MKHKHAELIKAWADDTSLKIQCRAPRSGRYDTQWVNHQEGEVPTWNEDLEYRIKPKTIKYRNFIWLTADGRPVVSCVSYEDNKREPRCEWNGFVKWINNWDEVEI